MMQAKRDKAKSKKKDKGKANSQTSQPCEVEADEPQALEDAPAEPLRLPMKKKRCMKAKTHNEVVDESTATPPRFPRKRPLSPTTVKKNLVDTDAVVKWSKKIDWSHLVKITKAQSKNTDKHKFTSRAYHCTETLAKRASAPTKMIRPLQKLAYSEAATAWDAIA